MKVLRILRILKLQLAWLAVVQMKILQMKIIMRQNQRFQFVLLRTLLASKSNLFTHGHGPREAEAEAERLRLVSQQIENATIATTYSYSSGKR